MSGAIYAAASGALNLQMRLGVLANNLSNINTVGFKEDRSVFTVPNTTGSKNNSSNRLAASADTQPYLACRSPFETKINFSPGSLKQTGNALNLAIEGNGFFCIETPGGIQYTRNGNFTVNNQKELVTREGFPVLGTKGKLIIDGNDIIFDGAGNLHVDGSQIGSLKIIDFPEPRYLEKAGGTMFVPVAPDFSGKKVDDIAIKQGFLELSNVDPISVMTNMIEVTRGFETYQKIIKSLDETTAKAINEVGMVV